LYYAFFAAETAVFAANQAAKISNPAAASQLDQQVATALHITVQDLPTVVAVVQQATQGYAQVPALRQSYVTATKSAKLTSAQVAGLDDFLRLDVTVAAVASLVKQLPAPSWAGLHGYITGGRDSRWLQKCQQADHNNRRYGK
jgi:hypothetical protein